MSVSKLIIVVILLCLFRPFFFFWPLNMTCTFLLQVEHDTLVSVQSVAQSCSTLCDPIDGSLPGSSIHEIFQVRVLEWGAIAFSASDTRKS